MKLEIQSAATCSSEGKTKQFVTQSSVPLEPEQSTCMTEAKRNNLKVKYLLSCIQTKSDLAFHLCRKQSDCYGAPGYGGEISHTDVLLEEGTNDMLFQQDRAPQHFHIEHTDILYRNIPQKFIRKG